MRRTLATGLVALSLALTTTTTLVSAAADEGRGSRPSAVPNQSASDTAKERATAALERARGLFADKRGGPRADRAQGARGGHGDATMLLRDLYASLDDLTPAQRREARGILARPTDSRRVDSDAYRTKSVKRRCGGHFCVHWVSKTGDRATRSWARKTLKLMNRVWKKEVGKFGYRRPLSDNGRGGDNRFDVYLKQLGSKGLYGYCAPERTKPGFRYIANGYCVLDNNFSFEEFGTAPMRAAKATAAHEFFHAVQFAYDYLEDLWMMEATATWMEEQVFDGVNDNRQYLDSGQLKTPWRPLDYTRVDIEPASIYANWVFYEFLSQTFGRGVVRKIWSKSGAYAGAPDMYSAQAITNVLKTRGGFPKAYARFVGANLLPASSYSEGSAWPSAELAEPPITLTSASRETGVRGDSGLLHMSSVSWRVDSSPSLTGAQYQLRVAVNGPSSFRMPAAFVQVVGKDGSVTRHSVPLNSNGDATIDVPFDNATVASVYVSLANASTRFKCGKNYVFSCNGLPIDDGKSFKGQPYSFTATVVG